MDVGQNGRPRGPQMLVYFSINHPIIGVPNFDHTHIPIGSKYYHYTMKTLGLTYKYHTHYHHMVSKPLHSIRSLASKHTMKPYYHHIYYQKILMVQC